MKIAQFITLHWLSISTAKCSQNCSYFSHFEKAGRFFVEGKFLWTSLKTLSTTKRFSQQVFLSGHFHIPPRTFVGKILAVADRISLDKVILVWFYFPGLLWIIISHLFCFRVFFGFSQPSEVAAYTKSIKFCSGIPRVSWRKIILKHSEKGSTLNLLIGISRVFRCVHFNGAGGFCMGWKSNGALIVKSLGGEALAGKFRKSHQTNTYPHTKKVRIYFHWRTMERPIGNNASN